MACDRCEVVRINGIVCHETGCPRQPKECKNCGQRFEPVRGFQFCSDECYADWFGVLDYCYPDCIGDEF